MKRPTLGEVKAYWAGDRSDGAPTLLGDPEEFYDHFAANGWMVGRSPMKDWHAAARNWSRNEVKFGHSGHVTERPYPSESVRQVFAKMCVGLSMDAYREAFKQKFGVPLKEEKP